VVILRLLIILVSLLAATLFIFGGLVLFQPEWIFTKLSQRSPEVLYSVETNQPMVALTIDDGPDPETTPLILDILADWDVQATFFVITDRIPGNENLIRRILSEGHEIGNHMTSDEPSIQLGLPEFERRLNLSASVLSEFGEIKWFRPGSGWYNSEMLETIHDKGYRCVLGSVYPYDPQLGSSWFSTRYVLWKVKPGSIIILHDHGTRGDRTVAVLKKILPELGHRGYRVVKLSDLVAAENTD
jgi:peptidoglycan/xylan/chitin deacetylase (PgdA/CDA1 family)